MERVVFFTLILLKLLLYHASLSASDRFVQGEVLVQLYPDVMPYNLINSARSAGFGQVNIIRQVSRCWNIWLWQVNQGREREIVRWLNTCQEVKAAQLNHYLSLRNQTPNDPYYYQQWNMNNTGQNGGKAGADIKAERAWDFTTGGLTTAGDTLIIAIVDGGIDLNHEDLQLWKNHAEIPNNGIDDDANGYIDDYHGWNVATLSGQITNDAHGTQVAGIAGAKGNNARGIAGTIWNVQLMPVQLLDYTDAEVAAAYSYVFEQRKLYDLTGGARGAFVVVCNSSFGEDYADPDDYPLWCGMYDSLGSIGILSVAATVNSYKNIDIVGDMPTSCSSPYLITVTNTTRLDRLANAGYGLTTVDIGAPGTSIITCSSNNTYTPQNGTSMAAPHVSGAIALLFAAACDSFIRYYKNNPTQASLFLKQIILDAVDILPDLTDKTVSGGRLNAFRSIMLLKHRFCAPCSLHVQATIQNVSCHAFFDGSAVLQVLDGTPPLIYDWSTGFDSYHHTSLGAGTYFAYILDSAGCTGSVTVTVSEPLPLTLQVTANHTTIGENNGSAYASVSGGTPPYHIQWSDADSTIGHFVNGLAWGHYTVTVTDNNGCTATSSFFIYNISLVNESYQAGFTLYPNPAATQLYIQLARPPVEKTQLICHDPIGNIFFHQEILHSDIVPISVECWPSGIYFVHVISTHTHLVQKIMVK